MVFSSGAHCCFWSGGSDPPPLHSGGHCLLLIVYGMVYCEKTERFAEFTLGKAHNVEWTFHEITARPLFPVNL